MRFSTSLMSGFDHHRVPCEAIAMGILLLLATQRDGVAQPDSVGRSLVDRFPCTQFRWDEWKGVSTKGAMLIPVVINGRVRDYQFDTGAGRTQLFGKENPDIAASATSVRLSNVEIGGLTLPVFRPVVNRSAAFDTAFAGTIGLDAVIGHIAIIDFPRQKFCLLHPADAPQELFARSLGAKATIRDGRFFVETTMIGRRSDSLFYDSGSSAMALSVDFGTWTEFTGRTNERSADRVIIGNAFGKSVNFVGARTQGDLSVGPIFLGPQSAFYRSEPLDFFARLIPEATGNFGNAPFFEDIVVIDATQFPSFRVFISPASFARVSPSAPVETIVAMAAALVNSESTSDGRQTVVATLKSQLASHRTESRLAYQLGKAGAVWGIELQAAEDALREYVRSPVRPGAPSHANAYFRLGSVLERKQDRAGAIDAFTRAIQADSSLTEAKQALERLRPPARTGIRD